MNLISDSVSHTRLRVALIGVLCCLSGAANAQDHAPSASEIKKAADSYDQGRERFRDGNFTEAAEKFEAADSAAPSAAALRLAIASRKEAGHLARAATLAALAVERYPDDDNIKAEAEAVLSEVSSDLGKISVTCDSPCELTMNNRLVHGQAAQYRTLYIEPGKISIRASWSEGRTDDEKLRVEAGDLKEVSFYAPPVAAVAPVVSPRTQTEYGDESANDQPQDQANQSKGWSPAVFWTGTVLTVGGLGTSVALGVRALNNPGKQAVIDNCEQGDRSCPEFKQGQANQTAATVAIGATSAIGLFTIITGIWLTDWGGKETKDQSSDDFSDSFKIRPLISVGDGAFLGAHGTF